MAKHTPPKKPAKEAGVIFRPYRTLPNGQVLWAKTYGLKAWAIPISDNDDTPAEKAG
jgi:hypothetical protein